MFWQDAGSKFKGLYNFSQYNTTNEARKTVELFLPFLPSPFSIKIIMVE
jgi:hypothetical protein